MKSSILPSLFLVSLALGLAACGQEAQEETAAPVEDAVPQGADATATGDSAVIGPDASTPGADATDASDAQGAADTSAPEEDIAKPEEDTSAPKEDIVEPEEDIVEPEPEYTSITLHVDMSCSGLDAFNDVFVTGPWNDWCGDCNLMADPDGDMIYSVTLEQQLVGSAVEYKYAVDGWASQEDLLDDVFLGGPCAPATDFDSYANRTLVVEPNSVASDTYGSCDPCFSVDGDFVGVGLQVYMGAGYTGPVSIIANWYKELGLNPLELPAMSLAKFQPLALDGIYQGQVKMLDGYVLRYRFVKGSGPNGEVETVPAECGEGVGDYVSRVYVWGDSYENLEVVPFGECNESSSTIDNDLVTAPIVINEVQYSMLNDVNGDGQFEFDSTEDEFIEFVNTSDAPVDMSGYTIQDTESLKAGVFNHVVPGGTVIEAGQALLVFGGGNPTGTFGGATVQTATSGSLSLDDFGDIITVADAEGATVALFDIEPLLNAPLVAYTRDPDLTGPFTTHVNQLSNTPGRANDGKPFGLELAEGQCYDNDFVASKLKQGITGCDNALSVLQASFGQNFGCKASLSVVGTSWETKLADICECMCPDFVEEEPYCVTLTLEDSAGDGWNGAFMAIDLVTYTLDEGSEASFEVCNVKLNAGCTMIFFHAGGSGAKKNEASWSIKDSQGNVIGSGGPETGSVGDGCGWLDNCNNCQSLGLNRMYCGKGNYSGMFGGCSIIQDGIKDCTDGRDEAGGTYTCDPYAYYPPEQ